MEPSAATVYSFLWIWRSSVKFSPVQSGDDLRAFGIGIEQQQLSQESKGGLADVSRVKSGHLGFRLDGEPDPDDLVGLFVPVWLK